MNLKRKIVYTSLVAALFILWIIFFACFEFVKDFTSEAFYAGMTSSTYAVNSFIYLLFKILLGCIILIFGLYTFLYKKQSRWYFVVLSLAIMLGLLFVPYSAVRDLWQENDWKVWVYGPICYGVGIAALIGLEYLTNYQSQVGAWFKSLPSKIFKKKEVTVTTEETESTDKVVE
jgi:hypothetical protein